MRDKCTKKDVICAKPRTIWIAAYTDYVAYAGFMQMNSTAISDDFSTIAAECRSRGPLQMLVLNFFCPCLFARLWDEEKFSKPSAFCSAREK